jgi:hypothetical protein
MADCLDENVRALLFFEQVLTERDRAALITSPTGRASVASPSSRPAGGRRRPLARSDRAADSLAFASTTSAVSAASALVLPRWR